MTESDEGSGTDGVNDGADDVADDVADDGALDCYFCGDKTTEFCTGCDEAVCENCDVVGLVSREHRPELHLGDDADEEGDFDVGD